MGHICTVGTGPHGSLQTVAAVACVERGAQRGVDVDCAPRCPVVLIAGRWQPGAAGSPAAPGQPPRVGGTSPAPPGHVGAATAHAPSSGSLPPDLLQGPRGVLSLLVFTPLIRPQLSFAFRPSFPDFPTLLSSFWPGRCCPKCSPVSNV